MYNSGSKSKVHRGMDTRFENLVVANGRDFLQKSKHHNL